jgi:aminomethyltransferase
VLDSRHSIFDRPGSLPLNSLAELKRTPLNQIHRQLGARMVDFGGWEMPVQYGGLVQEHMAVRQRAGIFDVSHMGEIEIRGPAAEETIQRVACNDVTRLAIGQCQYSALTTPSGAFVDDILVYRLGQDHFFLCVNASNQEKDFVWIRDNAAKNSEVLFRSHEFAQIAVQGPRALQVLETLTDIRLAQIRYYWFVHGTIAGADSLVSRTGYTGENGFEIYCSPAQAEGVWNRILDVGKPLGLEPAGLGARNTLRLEAKMALYGHDIDNTTTILEADLEWICRFNKGDFIGKSALLKQKAEGIKRKLVGFEMVERGIARDRYPIEIEGQTVGSVTSGSPAPFLHKNIGLAYLPIEHCALGTKFNVLIREKPVQAKVVPTPFYRRPKMLSES